jgi:hypothetical protein
MLWREPTQEPSMIVSRRSMLLAHPSQRCMRAAGYAASPAALQRLAEKQAAERFTALTGERVGKVISR